MWCPTQKQRGKRSQSTLGKTDSIATTVIVCPQQNLVMGKDGVLDDIVERLGGRFTYSLEAWGLYTPGLIMFLPRVGCG